MKSLILKNLLFILAIASISVFSSCGNNDGNDPVDEEKEVVVVEGKLTANTTWTKDKVYLLRGFVFVGDADATTIKSTATLTIEPGTVIFGERSSKGTLIISRGSKIIADGTATQPIVFTSAQPVGLKEPGDWGGVVICGQAKNNTGGVAQLEGNYGAFHGGDNDADNSGILRYVRIEYAGVPVNPNQEVNSLTLGSVGSGTTISYVMCTYGLDDAFEWFGGTVSCDHLVAYRGLDDDFDVDLGYTGKVQFGLSIREKSSADQSGSNGFEVDNDGSGSAKTPVTAPTFSNITVVGPKGNRDASISLQFQSAAQLRRGNAIKIHNSFFTGYPNGIFLDNNGSVAVTSQANSGQLVLKNNVVAGVEHWGGNGFGTAGTIFTAAPAEGKNHPNAPRGLNLVAGTGKFENGVYTFTETSIGDASFKDWFVAAAQGNTTMDKWQDAGVSGTVFENGKPTLVLNAGAALASGASFTGLTGFQTVAHRGAFGSTDWTTGWTEWQPDLKDYLVK